MQDWVDMTECLSLIFSIYMNPIFSLLGIIVQLITIIALTGKSIKAEIKKQYSYLIIYSVSNLLYMITILTSLINSSSVNGSIWSRYFALIVTILIHNSLKTFSNIAYLAFIMMRYIKISSTKNRILTKLDKISLKFYLLLATSLSIFSNSYLYFEMKINKNLKYFSNNLQDTTTDLFKTDFTDFEYKFFVSLQYLKFFLADMLFFILTIAIDLVLIYFIKKKISSSSYNREIKIKCKKRIIIMIILNGINFLLLRLPSLLINFYALFFNYKTRDGLTHYEPNLASFLVCRNYNFCESLDEAFNFLNLFSFLSQFVIFLKFDTNFKDAHKSLFIRK